MLLAKWVAISGEVYVLATERLTDFYFSTFESPPDPDGLLFAFWRGLAISEGAHGRENYMIWMVRLNRHVKAHSMLAALPAGLI